MGHILHELLSRHVQIAHSLQKLVEGVHDMNRLRIVRNGDALIAIALLYLPDGLRNSIEGSGQQHGKRHSQRHHHYHDQILQNHSPPVHRLHGVHDGVVGYAGEHDPHDDAWLHAGVNDRSGHLYVTMFPVIIGQIGYVLPLKTPDHFLGDDGFALADAISVSHHPEAGINDHHTPLVKV